MKSYSAGRPFSSCSSFDLLVAGFLAEEIKFI